ncbi:EutN/CcmL family microcompartment protein [Brevibacillus agri]|uniref:EutN/CcmL family microcompartment protein n=1 Tax=Brevibacillus agri TaxID=51101 RepID=UPI0018CF37AA|nr:EutN/CcmL family microcompartment protein [Brevibacillus agri]MBG9566284.1 ethanolamine utilization protein EutN [Brevibacillus agri]MED1642665.1 EutN/CcmL family microcompartment protein [Brevibacillus agri]MED1653267.1 EutN/CcmL family microcompartment protein [Brevibacillus agri]MED1687881.1 EutN/CcmL family microcompartment protein [Brevibacillus agri]MED1695347.1 EutN/CcmL family microcompartment protein [Brevibacillus agri]
MLVGKVIGSVWATRKEDGLTGLKLLIVQPGLTETDRPGQPAFVAVDRIGAGIGDHVMVTTGSSAASILEGKRLPINALIIGIIDSVDTGSG